LRLKKLQSSRRILKEEVTEQDIAEVVARWTGIPVTKMLEEEAGKLAQMEEEIGKRVVGQKDAIQRVADAVKRSRAGIADPNRPIGSFLFLGPTGVGKTELSKALAEFMFNDDKALIRIDMSEYMEKHSVARLIGAPPGYIGYDAGGLLTEAVRRKPYCLVLFDEIEKAHPDVFNILLQVLDDGRLTDGHGRTVDFRNSVLVMTSNLGSDQIQEMTGAEDYATMKATVLEVVSRYFRPEFINRIDELVVFHALQQVQIRAITDIQIERIAARLRDQDINIFVTTAARDHLGKTGYDPVYGARPLKRTIQTLIETPLAKKILSGEITSGTAITVDLLNHELIFNPDQASAA